MRDCGSGGKVVYYEEIALYVYCIENPKVNPTGVDFDQCQAAVSYFLPEWSGGLENGVIVLKESTLATPPPFHEIPPASLRAYLTSFALSGNMVVTKPSRTAA
jgi:hypothetical protein